MTDHTHRAVAVPRVLLEIEPDNHPSAAVARSAGFHLTEAMPEVVEDKGRSHTLLTWAHHLAVDVGRAPVDRVPGR